MNREWIFKTLRRTTIPIFQAVGPFSGVQLTMGYDEGFLDRLYIMHIAIILQRMGIKMGPILEQSQFQHLALCIFCLC